MRHEIPSGLFDAAAEPMREWLAAIAAVDLLKGDIELPEGEALVNALRYLEVPEEAIPEIAASRPDRERHPEGWWILERCVAMLVANTGAVSDIPAWPELPAGLPGVPGHLYIHAFVATIPHVAAYHSERGIPESQTQAILADLGRNVRVHEKRHATVGLGVANWITLHFRGLIYDLGRLQLERAKMRNAVADGLRHRGIDADPEETVLSVHIPDYKGPLTPASCDAAIACAREFFARHFPEERYRFAVCHSWLLDPQLRRYLRPDANIPRFQDRFELADRFTNADRSIVQFVFGPVPDDPADLPQRTSLERAVRAHLVSGEHWYVRNGWFPWEGVALGR